MALRVPQGDSGTFSLKGQLSFFACWNEIEIGALKTMSVDTDTESSFSSPPDYLARHSSSEIPSSAIVIMTAVV
jgi:hypothetical protein